VGVLLKENKMAGFQSGNLALIEGANSNAGRLWTYKYTTDTIAAISTSAYFSTADTNTGLVATDMGLLDGDVINIYGSDGYDTIIVDITAAGVVSVATNNSSIEKTVVGTFDALTAVNDAGGAIGAVGTYGLGVTIPDNAIITGAWYEVLIQLTDGGDDDTTIALQALAANDLVDAAAISVGTAFDAGLPLETIPKSDTPTTWIKMTAAKELKLVQAVDVLSAGNMRVYVTYLQSV
jgi:hypothetical protein